MRRNHWFFSAFAPGICVARGTVGAPAPPRAEKKF